MANVRGQGLQISDFNPQPGQASGLPDIPRAGGASADAMFAVSNALGAQVGKLGDTLAQAEGTKAGKIAGADPNWRPTDDMTIKGRAFDQAASEVYLSKLASNFQGDALDLYQKNQNDPAAFKTAYEGLIGTYKQQHVFPEAQGWFDAKAGDIANSLRTKVLSNWETNQKDKAHASLITDLSDSNTAQARLLAIDPHSPDTERSIFRMRDENIARIKADATAGNITETAAAKAILNEQDSAQSKIINARAATLGTSDQIDAYRVKLRKDFAAGKLSGLQDFDTLDAGLSTLSKAKKTQADQGLSELDGKVSDFLDRFGKGETPSSTEWLKLEDAGKSLGPAGAAAIDAARSKLLLRQKIASLSVADGQTLISNLEQTAKGSGAALRPYLGAGKDSSHVDNLDGAFSGSLGKMLASMPPDLRGQVTINSGFRTNERQAELFNEAVQKYGSEEAARKWVAPPGASNHNHGQAADLGFTSDAAKAWVHDNAGNFGLTFPMGHEDWHIEPIDKATHGAPGMDKTSAGVLDDARTALAAKRNLINQDPLLAGEREGILPQASNVDFSAAPDALGAQMRLRIAQSDAVAGHYQRPPQYVRPDEKPQMQAILGQGGDKALNLIDGVVRGAGGRANQVLAEVGGDAPELAHAGMVSLSTGDRSFARQVAEAIRARSVAGAKVPAISSTDMGDAMRKVIGPALNGMDASERVRTQAAASAWTEQELARRNIDPKDAAALPLVEEGVKRARGMTIDPASGASFGGLADLPVGGRTWGGVLGPQTTKVQVPADVKTDRLSDVFAAINDNDLKALPNAPMAKGDRVMTAAELRRATPIFGPGGYRFATVDPMTKIATPIVGKDGSVFTLPWSDISPTLRARVPFAFR